MISEIRENTFVILILDLVLESPIHYDQLKDFEKVQVIDGTEAIVTFKRKLKTTMYSTTPLIENSVPFPQTSNQTMYSMKPCFTEPNFNSPVETEEKRSLQLFNRLKVSVSSNSNLLRPHFLVKIVSFQ